MTTTSKLVHNFYFSDDRPTFSSESPEGLPRMLSLGSDLSPERLEQLVTSSANLENFKHGVTQTMEDMNADGVELDARSLSSPQDKRNLEKVLQVGIMDRYLAKTKRWPHALRLSLNTSAGFIPTCSYVLHIIKIFNVECQGVVQSCILRCNSGIQSSDKLYSPARRLCLLLLLLLVKNYILLGPKF